MYIKTFKRRAALDYMDHNTKVDAEFTHLVMLATLTSSAQQQALYKHMYTPVV